MCFFIFLGNKNLADNLNIQNHSNKKEKHSQINKQAPKISSHNSPPLTNQQTQQEQKQHQPTQQQHQQPTQQQLNQLQQGGNQTNHETEPYHLNSQPNTNNIPSNVPQLYQGSSQIGQQQQPSPLAPNYIPTASSHNQIYQMVATMPSVYYGYPHTMQPAYFSANSQQFVPADVHQNPMEQVCPHNISVYRNI